MSSYFLGARRALAPAIAMMAFAVITMNGCGGPNQDDLGGITGENPKSPKPTKTNTPLPTSTPVDTATPRTPRSLQFLGASESSLGIRGSGQPEQSILRFRVVDGEAQPIANVVVHFELSGPSLGGEDVSPAEAVSGIDGEVQTVLSSGTQAAAVRVVASVGSVTTQSTQVLISGSAPQARNFSVAAQFLNVSGRVLLGIRNQITVYVNDRNGNAVPAGTAVNFRTNGASVVDVKPTGTDGIASATLISEGGDIPPDGVVQVLVSTRGEEPFVDANGNGSYDEGEVFASVPEPFIDANGNDRYDPENPYERFIDTDNDGLWDEEQGQPGVWDDDVTIFTTMPVTFSGYTRVQLLTEGEFELLKDSLLTDFTQPDEPFRLYQDDGQSFVLIVRDSQSNPIVGGSTIKIIPGKGLRLIGPEEFTLGDSISGGQLYGGINVFSFAVADDTMSQAEPTPTATTTPIPPGASLLAVRPAFALDDEPIDGTFVGVTVQIKSSGLPAGGNGSTLVQRTGYVVPPPTATPTSTGTSTATPTPTPPAPPSATNTPTWTPEAPHSIQFVTTSLSTIGVRGSGITEQAQMVFRVFDIHANPVAGAKVNFVISPQPLGGEHLNRSSITTNGAGEAAVVLTSGTRTTSVRVVASIDGNASITAQSTQVSIVGAPPAAKNFSIRPQFLNFSGRVTYGLRNKITAFVNDRFGNAVPSGTVVTFISNGASIVDPQPTGTNGEGFGTLIAEGGDLPPGGEITVLAATRGEETFIDANGNGVYDQGESFVDMPEPFIDTNNNKQYDPNEPYERFIDTNNNGRWDAAQGAGVWDTDVLVWDTTTVVSSAHTRAQLLTAEEYADLQDELLTELDQPTQDFFMTEGGGSQAFVLVLRDLDSNPIVPGSVVTLTAGGATRLLAPPSFTIPDTDVRHSLVPGVNVFFFSIAEDLVSSERPGIFVAAAIESAELPAGGNDSIQITRRGFLYPPPTATPTPEPAPANIRISFSNQASNNGDGTLTSILGAVVTYDTGTVVRDGTSVQFRVVAPVPAGISLTSPGITGGVQPCTVSFPVQPQSGQALSCLKYTTGQQGDLITVQASVATPNGLLTDTQTIRLTDLRSTPTPTPTNAITFTPTPTVGTPRSIQFLGVSSSTIGVRGSGIPEQAVFEFRAVDSQARPVVGAPIDFSLSGPSLGGEELAPESATTDLEGKVKVTLSSGQRTTTVRVIARSHAAPSVFVQSTQVAIVGAPPSAGHFSAAPQFLNISGRVTLGLRDEISAFVNDRFGNAVPPGTVVSFITNGASIVEPLPTGTNGEATATLLTEGGEIPPDGIVWVLASTRGEESFTDTNGDGVYNPGEPFIDIAEPFIDYNLNGQYDADDPWERFIDVNNNGKWDTAQSAGVFDTEAVIWDAFPVTFSAHTRVQILTFEEYEALGDALYTDFSQPTTPFTIQDADARGFVVVVRDRDSNPLVGGSKIKASVPDTLELLSAEEYTVPDSQSLGLLAPGLNLFPFYVRDDTKADDSPIVSFTIEVTSESEPAGGNVSVTLSRPGRIVPLPPTATPEATSTPMPTATPTSPPSPAHIQLALFVNQASKNGDGTLTSVISALVTDGTGATAANDIPVVFSLVEPIPAGVSVTSPGLIGREAPCTFGFPVQAQPGDALSCVKYDSARQGQSVTIRATVASANGPLSDTQTIVLPDLRPTATPTNTATYTPSNTPTPTPAAAHIQVALFVNQAGTNGDGTLSSVISALVTDADGVVINNGIPVAFSLVNPVAGVSVTSPGLTGFAAPCTLSFVVQAQPGDALSCVKYDSARQGQSITVKATIQTPNGPLTDTQTITLPDLRPTATPTRTSTATPTQTPTATPAAAHIKVALFVNQAGSNGDGTLSSVVSALVTDATGAVVGNGVPVQFSLISPVAGVSVTNPGFTGFAAPCTLGFPVQAQPGDALSCVKYDSARQGETVIIQAVVQTPNGPLSDTQIITLPDLRPTATPTKTFTATPTQTPTPTLTPTSTPAAAHIKLALFSNQASGNGDGTYSTVISALVTTSTGAVVGNGVPVTFSITSPVPGVSVTSPGLTGQAPLCTLGFPVQAQPGDALSCIKYDAARQGQQVTIQATVQTPGGPLTDTQVITLPNVNTPTPTATFTNTPTSTPTKTPTPTPAAAHIKVALFVNQASSNGDGTLSTVISALVTDVNGAVVGNGVPVTFSLTSPIAGVSVTSPGLVGQAAPCTLGFPVQAQPGDALSCIKYDSALQGQSVTIQAFVSSPGGPLTDTQVVKLPDLRTSTPTNTPSATPTVTATRTPTATPAAAFLKVALFVNKASSNGDGTFSTVVSALVTDSTGAVVQNGIPVTFNLVNPVAGISVTSPGLTGADVPCTLDFTVHGQPGDALSCVKYDAGKVGTLITVKATVLTPNGSLTDSGSFTLPAVGTPIPTYTPTPPVTFTPTATATATPPPAFLVVAPAIPFSCPNFDGTSIVVVSAIVTDTNGNAVHDGLEVFFVQTNPIPGVAVTSPALTGGEVPCVFNCTDALGNPLVVPPQPADALTCIKFDNTLVNQSVEIRATVPVPGGMPLVATRSIALSPNETTP